MATAITMTSAVKVAKTMVKQESESPKRSPIQRLSLKMAGDASVTEIFGMIDRMGLCIAYKDENHPYVKYLLEKGLIQTEDDGVQGAPVSTHPAR